MNIVYATRATIPFASAASLNTVQMCQSLVELGHCVTLAIGRKFWRPRSSVTMRLSWGRQAADVMCVASGDRSLERGRSSWQDWVRCYGFEPAFDVTRFWELPKTGWRFDAAIVQFARARRALLYARYPRLLAQRLTDHVPSLLEVHSDVPSTGRRYMARALRTGSLLGVVVITATLRDHLLRDPRLAPFPDRFLVAADAVNATRFAAVSPALDLNQIGYVGSLFPGKGMERIEQIARLRPGLFFHVYGGRPREVRQWAVRLADVANLRLWGYVVPAEVPKRFEQFGIALLPNQPSVRLPNGDDIGQFTSPMKLFEYMAAGRAIIASDLPALREVLVHNVNCLLVPPDDPLAWTQAIDYLRDHPEVAQRLATRAKDDACGRYSYQQRFRVILDHFADPARRRLKA